MKINDTSMGRGAPPMNQAVTGRHPLISGLLNCLWFLVPGLLIRCGALRFRPKGARFLEDYFTRTAVLRRVARMRIKIAKKRHDQHFLYNLNAAHRLPASREQQDALSVCAMTPPRRQWTRPRLGVRDAISSQICSEISVLGAIKKTEKQKVCPEWLHRLNCFVTSICQTPRHIRKLTIAQPRVSYILKDKKKNTYRPLATYPLRDQVIIGLAAQHLRDTVDPFFGEFSFAFRARRSDGKEPLDRTAAIDRLVQYVKRHRGATLYVAECDIQKFFDAVNHDIATNELNAILEARRAAGQFVDQRLLKIFEAYLASYNFKRNVADCSQAFFQRKGWASASVPWVENELNQYYPDGLPEHIGVPQGGALSPVIANIMLHKADSAIDAVARDQGYNDFYYARYCDDMMIVSSSKEVTSALFKAYLSALEELKLPYHQPEEVTAFSRAFFETKSKSVYAFASPRHGGVSPWVSLLGYQVRFDGRLRVRKASLEKEILKQRDIFKNVIRSIDRKGKKLRVGLRQALHRARLRLIAMSVGKADIHFHGPGCEHEMCWVSGFELLKRHKLVRSQLKILDRARGRFLARLESRLKKAGVPRQLGRTILGNKHFKFYGRPFSYYGQFIRRAAPPPSSSP